MNSILIYDNKTRISHYFEIDVQIQMIIVFTKFSTFRPLIFMHGLAHMYMLEYTKFIGLLVCADD